MINMGGGSVSGGGGSVLPVMSRVSPQLLVWVQLSVFIRGHISNTSSVVFCDLLQVKRI